MNKDHILIVKKKQYQKRSYIDVRPTTPCILASIAVGSKQVTPLDLEAEAYDWTDCGTVQNVLLGSVRSHVPAQPAARQSFSYTWAAAGWGELYMFMYRRPTLCTLDIAVDFLKSLEIAVVWGGGVVLGYCAYIISL